MQNKRIIPIATTTLRQQWLDALGGIDSVSVRNKEWYALLEEDTRNSLMIEGVFIERHELKDALANPKHSPSGYKILGYFDAALASYELAFQQFRSNEFAMTKSIIRQIHSMMFRADPNFGYSPGEWRRGEIEITGATIKPVHWSKIEEKIETLIEIINDPEENLIRKTAVAHNFFEQVHPFPDGNGRVGRILMNFILVGHGFPNIAIKGKEQDRKIYIAALEEGDPIVAPMIKNSTSKIVRPLVKLEDLINKSLAIAMDVVICNRFEKIKNLMTTNQLAAAIARPVTSVRVACSQKKFICANIAGKIMSHPDLLETPNPRDFLQRA